MRPWLAMVPVLIPVFMVNVDITAVNLALARISRELDVSLSVVQWMANGYMMTAGAFLILGGRLADAWGKRRMLAVGVLVFMAGSAAAGASSSGAALIASRMFQGMGFLIMPLALSLAHDIFPENRKSLAMGVTAAVTGLSISVGPTLGGFILHVLDWHWVFWINLPLGLAAIALAFLFLPETPTRPSSGLDLPGQALLALGIFALTGGLNALAGEQGAGTGMAGVSLAGLLFLLLFLVHERRAPGPLMDPELLKNRPFVLANGARLAMQWSYMGFLFLVCLYLQNVVLLSSMRSGLLLLWITVTMAVLSPACGALMDRVGVRVPLAAAFLVAATAYGMVSFAGFPIRMGVLVPCFLAIGASYGVLMPGCNEAALGAVPGEKSGAASGILYTLVFVGSSVAVAATGLTLHLVAGREVDAGLTRRAIGLSDEQMDCLLRAATGVEDSLAQCPMLSEGTLYGLESLARQSFQAGFQTCMLSFAVICMLGAFLAGKIREPISKAETEKKYG